MTPLEELATRAGVAVRDEARSRAGDRPSIEDVARRRLSRQAMLAVATVGVVAVAIAATVPGIDQLRVDDITGQVPEGPVSGPDAGVPEPSPHAPSEPLGRSGSPGPELSDDRDELDVPLAGRFGHTVTWTGKEVIVWGGEPTYGDAGPAFGDGARFDPTAGEWERLPTPPVVDTSSHLALWTGQEVLFLGGRQDPRQVLAFDPATDRWRTGAPLPFDVTMWTGAVAWSDDRALVLADDGLVAYDPVADAWNTLTAPPLDLDEDGTYALFVDGTGRVVAVGGARSGTGGIDVALRSPDGRWQPGPSLPEVIGEADGGDSFREFPRPKLTVLTDAGLLFVPSAGPPIPAMLWQPGDDDWARLDVPPKAGCEDIPSPVAVDGGAMTTGCDPADAVWFDPTTRQFTELVLPGWMWDQHAVWTGTELVTISGSCCDGATGAEMVSWRHPISTP